MSYRFIGITITSQSPTFTYTVVGDIEIAEWSRTDSDHTADASEGCVDMTIVCEEEVSKPVIDETTDTDSDSPGTEEVEDEERDSSSAGRHRKFEWAADESQYVIQRREHYVRTKGRACWEDVAYDGQAAGILKTQRTGNTCKSHYGMLKRMNRLI